MNERLCSQNKHARLAVLQFVQILAESLDCAGGTIGFRGTPVEYN